MAASFEWTIQLVDDFVKYEGKEQVIYNLHWDCNGNQDSEGKNYVANAYGTQALNISDLSSFTPYSDVTQDECLQWLYDANKDGWKEEIEAKVQEVINKEITPTSESGVPWE